jgi:hypothetical protein
MHFDSLNRFSPAHAFLLGLLCIFATALISAQDAPATSSQAQNGLEELVGRIALYPDDLVSIILPAATFPLQIVEADRWLKQNKGKEGAEPKASWDDSVKALINYPDVVTMMSQDLDWTASLGEAVATDQTRVMDAVQSFRRKADGAGNLKSDEKQVVVVEKEVVKIVQADPQVIYVPQYDPQVVVVQQTVPVYPAYYPNPYPVYYYPYPPGAAFAAGVVWGATVAWACDWHHGSVHNDININRNINIDNSRNNINNRPTNIDSNRSQQMAQQNKGSWQSRQSGSDVRQGRTPTSMQQGAVRSANTAQASNRATGSAQGQRSPSQYNANRQDRSSSAYRSNAGSPNYSSASRGASAARSSPPSRDAFSGMSGSRSVNAQSSRGAASRGSFSRGGGRRR